MGYATMLFGRFKGRNTRKLRKMLLHSQEMTELCILFTSLGRHLSGRQGGGGSGKVGKKRGEAEKTLRNCTAIENGAIK